MAERRALGKNEHRVVIEFKPGLTPLQRALTAIEFDYVHAKLLAAISEDMGAPGIVWTVSRREFTGVDADVQPVYDEIMRTLDKILDRKPAAPPMREET